MLKIPSARCPDHDKAFASTAAALKHQNGYGPHSPNSKPPSASTPVGQELVYRERTKWAGCSAVRAPKRR
jgi:hypothetical protein